MHHDHGTFGRNRPWDESNRFEEKSNLIGGISNRFEGAEWDFRPPAEDRPGSENVQPVQKISNRFGNMDPVRKSSNLLKMESFRFAIESPRFEMVKRTRSNTSAVNHPGSKHASERELRFEMKSPRFGIGSAEIEPVRETSTRFEGGAKWEVRPPAGNRTSSGKYRTVRRSGTGVGGKAWRHGGISASLAWPYGRPYGNTKGSSRKSWSLRKLPHFLSESPSAPRATPGIPRRGEGDVTHVPPAAQRAVPAVVDLRARGARAGAAGGHPVWAHHRTAAAAREERGAAAGGDGGAVHIAIAKRWQQSTSVQNVTPGQGLLLLEPPAKAKSSQSWTRGGAAPAGAGSSAANSAAAAATRQRLEHAGLYFFPFARIAQTAWSEAPGTSCRGRRNT
eukprot:gene9542-biopygen7193